MVQINDTDIRASVRSTLTQLRLDVQVLAISSARGVVRITGELRRNTAETSPIRATMLEDFERELKRVKGVRRVHLVPVNWRQTPGGSWVAVGQERRPNKTKAAVRAATGIFDIETLPQAQSTSNALGFKGLLASLKEGVRSIPLHPA